MRPLVGCRGQVVRHESARSVVIALWGLYGLVLLVMSVSCMVACVMRDARPFGWVLIGMGGLLAASALLLPPLVVMHRKMIQALFTSLGEDLDLDVDLKAMRAEGAIQGFRVFVEKHEQIVNQSKRVSILITTRFPYSLGLGLDVQRQGSAASPELTQIPTGDPEFDRQFLVQGRAPQQILGLLTAQRRSSLLGRLAGQNKITVTDRGVTELYNYGVSLEVIKNAVVAGPFVAQQLLGASRPAEPPPPAP